MKHPRPSLKAHIYPSPEPDQPHQMSSTLPSGIDTQRFKEVGGIMPQQQAGSRLGIRQGIPSPQDQQLISKYGTGQSTQVRHGAPRVGERKLVYAGRAGTDPLADLQTGRATPIVDLMRKYPGYIGDVLPYGWNHQAWLLTQRVIRKSVPALDAAIIKRRFLEGSVVVEADDQGLENDINDWIENVQVGYTPDHPVQGLQVWLDRAAENADEMGLGLVEIRMNESGTELERLVAPDPRLFSFQRIDGDPENWYLHHRRTREGKVMGQRLTSPMVRTLQLSHDNTSPWGRALASGLEFTAEVFIRMWISLNNLVWRMGDPSKIWKLMYDPEAELKEGQADTDLDELLAVVQGAYEARNQGNVADAFFAAHGAEVQSEALGENIIVSSMAAYMKPLLGLATSQIIGKADVPAWLYPAGIVPSEGLNSDRAQMEGTIAQAAAQQRAQRIDRLAAWAINTWLISTRGSRFVGQYTIHRSRTAPISEKMRQEARSAQASADATFVDTADILRVMEVVDGQEGMVDYLRKRGVIR